MRLKTQDGILNESQDFPISYRMMWPEKMENPAPGVVFAPGFGSSLQTSSYIQESLERVAELGAVAISFNYSHIKVKPNNDVDTGKLTCENADDDFRRVLDFAKNNPMIDNKKLVGMGCSFGANTMFRVKDMDLAAYIAFSLVPDFIKPFQEKLTQQKRLLWKMSQYFLGAGTKQVIDGHVQEISYQLFEQAEKINLQERVSDIKQPVTLIHGTEDILASVDDIKALQQSMTQSSNINVHFIEGAGHKFQDQPKKGELFSELQQAISLAQKSFLSLFSVSAQDTTAPAESGIAGLTLPNLALNIPPLLQFPPLGAASTTGNRGMNLAL